MKGMYWEGNTGAACWGVVEAKRQQLGKTTDDMAAILGFPSGGSYRGHKAKGKMPHKSWRLYVRRYDSRPPRFQLKLRPPPATLQRLLDVPGKTYLDKLETLLNAYESNEERKT